MARERMVTRTVNVSKVEVLCMDTEKAEVVVKVYDIGGGLTDENLILKAIKKQHETDTFKCVKVSSVEQYEVLYGMPESKFIELASILPNRGTKAEG